MSVGMILLPAPPVKAPSPNSCPAPSKPLACHTSGKSLKFSTSSDTAITHRAIVLCYSNSFTLNSFADPHPLNPDGSIFYKIREGGSRMPHISSSSNFPNSPEDSSCQKLAVQKSGFVILKLIGDLSNRDQTSHLDRSIPQHRSARLGLHQRPAEG